MANLLGLELHEAASSGDYDTLEELVRTGKYDLNLRDEDWSGKTALHWAAQKGYVECVRLLLESGAKGNARTDTGWTPAHFAAETGKLTALRALHSSGVPIDRPDNYGMTPRRMAEVYNHTECVRFLIQAELELEEKRLDNDTTLSEGDDDWEGFSFSQFDKSSSIKS